jgi:hypothetical protein
LTTDSFCDTFVALLKNKKVKNMPNEENPTTPPTDVPSVDLGMGAKQPQPDMQAAEGVNPYTADQAHVMGEESVDTTTEPSQPNAFGQPAEEFKARVDIQGGDPNSATVAYPGLDTPSSSPAEEVSNTGGLGGAPSAPSAELPVEEQTPVTYAGADTGEQQVAPPVIGAAPEESGEDQNSDQYAA